MIAVRKSDPGKMKLFATGTPSKPYRFWQAGGGYDRNIVSKETLIKAIDYIHNNPLRGGLVKSPEDWKWSSYLDWSGLGCGPIALDTKDIPPT